MSTTPYENVESYRFPRRRTIEGLWGLRPAQVILASAGLVSGVFCFLVFPFPRSLVLGFPLMVLGALLAWIKVKGLTLDQWTPVVGGFAWRRWTGETVQKSVATRQPVEGDGVVRGAKPPRALRRVQLIPGEGHGLGLIRDGQIPGYLAVLRVTGGESALGGLPALQGHVAEWGRLLDWFSKVTSGRAIMVIERTYPESSDEIGRDLNERLNVDSPRLARGVESYLRVVDTTAPQQPRHEAFIAVEFPDARIRSRAKRAGKGMAGITRVVLTDMEQIAEQLELKMQLSVEGILGPRQLSASFRNAFDPGGRIGRERSAVVRDRDPGVPTRLAWPLSTEDHWDAYRSDSAWSTTWQISEWPLQGVTADFSAPLMMWPRCERTVSITYRPIPITKARRQNRMQQIVHRSNRDQLEEWGSNPGAAGDLEHDDLLREDVERALGAATYRFAGYVTVSAPTKEELEERNLLIGRAVHDSQLEVQRLWGQQEVGFFAAALPLCRGVEPGLFE